MSQDIGIIWGIMLLDFPQALVKFETWTFWRLFHLFQNNLSLVHWQHPHTKTINQIITFQYVPKIQYRVGSENRFRLIWIAVWISMALALIFISTGQRNVLHTRIHLRHRSLSLLESCMSHLNRLASFKCTCLLG